MTCEGGVPPPALGCGVAGLAERASDAGSLDDVLQLIQEFSLHLHSGSPDPAGEPAAAAAGALPGCGAQPAPALLLQLAAPGAAWPVQQLEQDLQQHAWQPRQERASQDCEGGLGHAGISPFDQLLELARPGAGSLSSRLQLPSAARGSCTDDAAGRVDVMPSAAAVAKSQPRAAARGLPQQHPQHQQQQQPRALLASTTGSLAGGATAVGNTFAGGLLAGRLGASGSADAPAPSIWDPAAAGRAGGGLLPGAGATGPVPPAAPQVPFSGAQPQLPLQLQLQLLLNGAGGGAGPFGDAAEAHAGLLHLHAAAAAAAAAGGAFPDAAAGGLLGAHHHNAVAAAAAAAAAAVSAAARRQQYLEPAAMALAAGWGNARHAFDAAQSFGPAAVRAMLPQTLNAMRTGCEHDLGGGSDSGGSTPVKKTRRGCRGGRRKHWYLAQQMAAAALGAGGCPPPCMEPGAARFGALVALQGARQ
ncbi:hypothetical protein Rsub_09977 [Raphidocelis subcapitata]|uniref:Uncharacterized protein n=1 Tax=Raphidocelis subcapitata TaxID=307507 RepID=A0A2V0PBR5_9CHLO|nr:hypothetical protein Rsub_09977 [Raphidocelis subcapitata]|eukprot:GBF97286.1 hypothetical protein Rsub_09977 [Raphidocelis subcapitata]